MADLLIELFSEEIPARMQAKAADDLKRMMADALKATGLGYDSADSYVTPRRLTLHMTGIPAATPDVREERRGPRADAPEKAIEGFLRGAGVSRDACEERETPKGTFLFAVIEKKGRASAEVIAEALTETIKTFPWPKSQRWGKKSVQSGSLKWVRPLQSILCLFDGKTVDGSIGDLGFGKETHGHRFMAPDSFAVADFDDYTAKLRDHKVMLDAKERMDLIEREAKRLVADKGLEWVEDRGLLAEVAGLVEWPVPLMGGFDEGFMAVPEEVLILTMKKDQKYFVTRDPKTGKLAPHFITVANIEPSDGGVAVAAGNERVLTARLSDAKFFWEQDLKGKLDDNLEALKDIVFHKDLGSVHDRVERIKKLARYLAEFIPGCDADAAERAAELCKADLVSSMVYEFPEVQGAMGRYYAQAQGESDAVADAIKDHYAPLGPNDACPTAPVSVAVALAEKLDTLVCFFAIDQKPTGSKDPFALRRAALGVIRLITESSLRLGLAELTRPVHSQLFQYVSDRYMSSVWQIDSDGKYRNHNREFEYRATTRLKYAVDRDGENSEMVFSHPTWLLSEQDISEALETFFADRLKVQQREKGVQHDLIDAVFANGDDDLVRVLARVDALSNFLATDDGVNLLAGYKRAANILKIEEKKDDRAYGGDINPALLQGAEEKALAAALETASADAAVALETENFEGAMAALAALRAPIDAFFDAVIVNAEDADVRVNRLTILSHIRNAVNKVADFDKIEG